MLTSGKMSLHELQTIYGTEDLYNMVDLLSVEAHNAREWANFRRDRAK